MKQASRILCASLALVSCCSLALAGTTWEDFVARPAPEKAGVVQGIEYSSAGDLDRRLDADLAILETQVLAGDREAVGLAFRLLGRSDGRPAEGLSVLLGRLARVHPALFLEALQANRAAVARLEALLGGLGAPYVDRQEARLYELQCRREALLGVENVELKPVREECLEALRKLMAEGR
jgi:hypothetical protein